MNVMLNRKFVQDHLQGLKTEKKDPAREEAQKAIVRQLLQQKNAVLIAHYYTDAIVQELADETGGFVGDSLEMARWGAMQKAETLVVAGVRFMGETAKILSPEKTVLMPTLKAECSLDLGCPVDEFSSFCEQHPDRDVVIYANTSAAVKACADWVVTSSCALDIVESLDSQGKKLIWGPDRFLGSYIQKQTGADMLLWQSNCIVHEEFKSRGILDLKKIYPDAAVLVHPESPEPVIELADVVGSTSRLLKASHELPNQQFIVATDRGIFYKMQQASPGKQFIEAPTAGSGAGCKSCAHCPWMAMNTLDALQSSLDDRQASNQILISDELREKALKPLNRMLDFTASRN